jgi:transcriptional regulator with XRE-family HTH domain
MRETSIVKAQGSDQTSIRKLRKERGWTQFELAERAGLSPATISAYEVSRRSWTRKALVPIAEALGVPLKDLLVAGEKSLSLTELVETALKNYEDELPKDPAKAERIRRYLELIQLELDT